MQVEAKEGGDVKLLAKNQKLENRNTELERQIKEMTELENDDDYKSEMDGDYDDQESVIDNQASKDEINKLKAEHSKQIQLHISKLDSIEAEKSKLQEQLKSDEALRSQLETQLKEKESKISDLETQVCELKA